MPNLGRSAACHSGHREIAKDLIEAGAALDVCTTVDGETALFGAARRGHTR